MLCLSAGVQKQAGDRDASSAKKNKGNIELLRSNGRVIRLHPSFGTTLDMAN